MKYVLMSFLLVFFSVNLFAVETEKGSAIIDGYVYSDGQKMPFVSVAISGTTIGTTTDNDGHFVLKELPAGNQTIKVSFVGYTSASKTVELVAGETEHVKFTLKKDVLGLDQVVVTADRNETHRKEAPVIVNTITPKLFAVTSSTNLSQSLNFTPGVRVETDCQNCGFTQVRMDGMDGAYSQILINGRAVFNSLAGVYGLEMIPANMLERVEVVRGGGSALYGSSAIAGTINLILRDPIRNSYAFGVNGGAIGVGVDGSGDPAQDYSVNANTSVVSEDNKTGMTLFGYYHQRQPFDATGDGYSEVTKQKNTTFGARLFQRLGDKSKLTEDYFNIREDRRGGDKFDYVEHEADIAESLRHTINTGSITYDQYTKGEDLWSVYASGQYVDRNSYYGAEQSLQDYGKTKSFTTVVGSQYNAHFGSTDLIGGIEYRYESLNDKKLGYPDYDDAEIENDSIISIPHTDNTIVADQKSGIIGAFAQYEFQLALLKISVGGRYDHYNINDKTSDTGDNSGDVLSPRVTLKYDVMSDLQARLSYSKGYRAPQVYDEDLHVETSGARQVVHENDPDLQQETSHSFLFSLDYNKHSEKVAFELLAEAFYTQLDNAFVTDYGDPDDDGTVIYTRTNAEHGAHVAGVNLEMNLALGKLLTFNIGFTQQSGKYKDVQEFDSKKFFRSPDNYGYFTLDMHPMNHWGVSVTGNYTGKMLVPYFGNTIADPDAGALRESPRFMDVGAKIRYAIKLSSSTVELSGGVRNIFNSYQDDFDEGVDRDSSYIYGPSLPRTIYFGVKIGNIPGL